MKSRFWSSDWFAGLPITIVVVLLSGSLPFKADLVANLMLKITNEDAADVRTLRANIPEPLAAVINKALLKDLEPGYQSGAEFTDALKVFLKT